MSLDVWTLTFVGGFVTLSTGLFLFAYWWHDRSAKAVLWWAASNCGSGIGVVLLSLGPVIPFFISSIVAPLILNLCAVLAFIAARIFNRLSINWYYLVAGVGAWIVMLALISIYTRDQYAAAGGIGISGCFYAAAAHAFWLTRAECLRGRMPMIGILGLEATALFLLTIHDAGMPDYSSMPSIGWLGSIHFVGLVYATSVTLLLIIMSNERREEKYKRESLTDPLTGLANRRAFLDRAQRLFDRAAQNDTPVALLAFDLDRFKRINDTFGHATGDKVLKLFADTLSGALRPTTLTARLGGEEFIAVIISASDQAAVAIANRVRDAFQRAALFVDGQRMGATVSVGVATTKSMADNASPGLSDVLASADAALYRAKDTGRNRVFLAGSEAKDPVPGNVIRLA